MDFGLRRGRPEVPASSGADFGIQNRKR